MFRFWIFHLSILFLCFNTSVFGKETTCPVDSILTQIRPEAPMDFVSALKIENISIDDLFETVDTACVIKLYRNYITNNGGKGHYYLVFDDLWEAMLLADQANLYYEKFYINKDIARFYGYLKKIEKAEEHFQEAYKYKKYIEHNKKDVFIFHSTLTNYHIQNGNLDLAKLYLDSCYQFHVQENLKKNFFLEHKRACILREENKHEEALNIFQEVADSLKATRPSFVGIVHADIGETYYKLEQYSKSMTSYLKAESTIIGRNKHVDHLPEIYAKLAEINHALGNHEEAYKMSKKEIEFNLKFFDSRYGVNSHLLRIQDNFRAYKINEEIRIKKLELNRLQQDQKLLLFQRLILISSIVFLSILALGYFKLQKGKINAEKELNQKLQIRNVEKQELLQRIEKKNEALITFSNIMSHDLKAPLRNISSFSSLIKRQLQKDFDKEKIIEFNNFVINSTSSMTALIEDLLMHSKIDIENHKFKPTDLNDLVEAVLPSFAYDINSGYTAINIDSLPQIEGDKDLLKTVFHNLISNGIKYQPKDIDDHHSTINLWSTKAENEYHVFIEDNGIGINQNFEKNLFEPFTRNHSSAEYSGTGLGLSMCQKIMQKHNGKIELEKTSEAGSIFKLIFPIGDIKNKKSNLVLTEAI